MSVVERCSRSEYQRRYDRIAADHLAHWRMYGTNPWMPNEAELRAWTVDHVRALVPDGASVIDCGCGIGLLLADLADVYDAVGIDIVDAYLDQCREQGLEANYGWLEEIPCPDDVFDAAVCVDVLEHVLDPAKAAAEVRRVVKPGGTVVVRVPHLSVAAVGEGGDSYDFPVHLQAFTPPELALLFNAKITASDERYDDRKRRYGEVLVGLELIP